jgi:hypothetical protein
MVDHLTEREEEWVKGGKLVIRDENLVFSPNYPKEYYPEEIKN